MQIPISERRVLPLLMLTSLTVWTAALLMRHPRLVDTAAFEEEQRRFEEVFKASFERHAETMDRYALEGASSGTLAESVMPANPRTAMAPSDTGKPHAAKPTAAKPHAANPRVDLNSAGIDELVTLPRIGPAIARRILDWRAVNGRFTSVEQLMEVRGIGKATLGHIRPFVFLNTGDPIQPDSTSSP